VFPFEEEGLSGIQCLIDSLGVNAEAIDFQDGVLRIEGSDSLDIEELLLELEERFGGDGEDPEGVQ
jgi:acyl carrier protein